MYSESPWSPKSGAFYHRPTPRTLRWEWMWQVVHQCSAHSFHLAPASKSLHCCFMSRGLNHPSTQLSLSLNYLPPFLNADTFLMDAMSDALSDELLSLHFPRLYPHPLGRRVDLIMIITNMDRQPRFNICWSITAFLSNSSNGHLKGTVTFLSCRVPRGVC